MKAAMFNKLKNTLKKNPLKKNTLNIYLATDPESCQLDLARFKLDPLIKVLKDDYKKVDSLDTIYRCPSFTDSLKNVFVYRSLFDFSIKMSDRGIVELDIPEGIPKEEFSPLSISQDEKIASKYVWQLFSTGTSFFPFAEEPCIMEMLPPYYHDYAAKVMTGRYDIGQWFRPFHPAIINLNRENLHYKRGQPLMYVKFHTDKKINFVDTTLTHKAENIARSCSALKFYSSNPTMQHNYNAFNSTTAKKRLLEELEANRKN